MEAPKDFIFQTDNPAQPFRHNGNLPPINFRVSWEAGKLEDEPSVLSPVPADVETSTEKLKQITVSQECLEFQPSFIPGKRRGL